MGRTDDVSAAVQNAIAEKAGPGVRRIHVTWLPAGVLALEGQVASLADKQRADAIAHEAAGNVPVENALAIETAADGDLEVRAREAVHGAGIASLGVSVEDGVAHLGGRAEGLAIVLRACEALAQVPGIRGIRHDRVVLHMARERDEIAALAALDAWDILAGVRFRLSEALPPEAARRIVTTCRDGTVTLTGIVDGTEVKERAEELARKSIGVETVRNLLLDANAPPPRATGLEDRIRAGIGVENDRGVPDVRAYVVDGVAYLTGRVRHRESVWRAIGFAQDEPGVNQVFDGLKVVRG